MSASDAVLLLIDGYGLVYRAFFAMPAMSTSSGVPTQAVYGAIRMIQALSDTWQATHRVVIFDGGLPEERMTLVEDYKAQRPSMPDDLRTQVPLIEEYLDAAGIHRICVEGEEADDVMASIALRGCRELGHVHIATSDKDLYQVVGEGVDVVPLSGKGPALDADGVHAKTGVRPEQIVDWLALVGDAVDNIPGVPGVGVKTAARLLASYQDIEGIVANLDDLAGRKVGEALGAAGETLARNRKMVRLRTALDCIPAWDALAVTTPDATALLRFYETMEFHQMAKALREPELF